MIDFHFYYPSQHRFLALLASVEMTIAQYACRACGPMLAILRDRAPSPETKAMTVRWTHQLSAQVTPVVCGYHPCRSVIASAFR
jgi:hypothetical protein